VLIVSVFCVLYAFQNAEKKTKEDYIASRQERKRRMEAKKTGKQVNIE